MYISSSIGGGDLVSFNKIGGFHVAAFRVDLAGPGTWIAAECVRLGLLMPDYVEKMGFFFRTTLPDHHTRPTGLVRPGPVASPVEIVNVFGRSPVGPPVSARLRSAGGLQWPRFGYVRGLA